MRLRPLVRRLGRKAPPRLRWAVTRTRARLRHPFWGNLRRFRPFSERYGFDRGTPVDRHYLHQFVAAHAGDLRGRLLEVSAPYFIDRFAAGDVESVDILDLEPRNDQATLMADLCEPGSLPRGAFHAVLLMQTLQYVPDLDQAVRNVWDALAPSGVLLVSVPSVSRIDPSLPDLDATRLVPTGLHTLLSRACPGAQLEVRGYGNLLTTVASLMGLAAEELRPAELDHLDPDFPLVACARARKAGA